MLQFEICAVNIQSARAAQEAGAHRIELCSALDVGGLTPSLGLIRAAVQQLDIPVNVLIRPREGDFTYNKQEFEVILDDIRLCQDAGVNGVVVGALTADMELDPEKMLAMKAAAGTMEMVCHRAFDFTSDPQQALESLIHWKYQRVLSSGQKATALEGRLLLQKLIQQAAGRISVMPGAGISADNIQTIAQTTLATEFHFTGKKKTSSSSRDIPGLDSWYWESDVELIRKIIKAVQD
jgi:copper homeostasis protein